MKLLEAIPLLLDGTLARVELGYVTYALEEGQLVYRRAGKLTGQTLQAVDFEKDWTPIYKEKKVVVGDTVSIAMSKPEYHGKIGKVTGLYYDLIFDRDLATLDTEGNTLFPVKNLIVEKVVTRVILGYRGVGKSKFAKLIENVLEIDVDEFRTLHGSLDLMSKVVNKIKSGIGVYDYIVVDLSEELIHACTKEGIKVVSVFPVVQLKDEFISRYLLNAKVRNYLTNSFNYDIQNLQKLVTSPEYTAVGSRYLAIHSASYFLEDLLPEINKTEGN